MLLTNNQAPCIQGGLAVVGCYRSKEVYEAYILSNTIRSKVNDIQEPTTAKTLAVTEISIWNLTIQHVQKLLTTLLNQTNAKKVKGLARIYHEKTMANVFFFIHFLSDVHNSQLLTLDITLVSCLGPFSWGSIFLPWTHRVELSMAAIQASNLLAFVVPEGQCHQTS